MTQRHRSEEITINLTPMIDVVFLLVIFFMVASKFSEADNRIKINVPSGGQAQSLARTPDMKVVSIDGGGQIFFDDSPITLADLTTTLQQKAANYPAIKVTVRGDENMSLGRLSGVVTAIQTAGVQQIALANRSTQASARR